MATLAFPFADSPATFGINFDAASTAPASALAFGDFSRGVLVASQVSPTRLRVLIAAEVAEQTAAELANLGQTVPADRIQVTLV